MWDLPETFDQLVPHLNHMGSVFGHIRIGLLQCCRHRADARNILCSGAFSALLRAAFNQVGKPDSFSTVEETDPLGSVKFMGGGRQHVFPDIYRDMPDGLDSIGVKQYISLPADRSDLPDRLNGTDLIIGIHDGYQTGILPDRFLHLGRKNDSIFMNIKQGDIKALFFQLIQSVQNRMMFKGSGYDMPFPFSRPDSAAERIA